jgi:hypothetical protein
MSSPRFGSLDASFLVRKGEAAPSAVAPAQYFSFPRATERAEPPPAYRAQPQHDDAPHPGYAHVPERLEPAPRMELHERSFGASLRDMPPLHHDHFEKPRRLMVSLTPEEYETLGIIAVKQGVTRHQLLRMALDDYLEELVEECGRSCECISKGWSCGSNA